MPKQKSDSVPATADSISRWADSRRRIDRLRAMIESGWRVEPARVEAILRERARKLAQPPAAEAAVNDALEIIEFALAREHYGVASAYVREVFALSDVTPVPCTPHFVLGIANVRGQIISIVDLRKYFGLPGAGITDLNKIIVLEGFGMSFGIVVDGIVDVRRIAEDELLPPTNISGIEAQYLLGVTARRIAVIDTTKLLSDRKIIVDEVVSI